MSRLCPQGEFGFTDNILIQAVAHRVNDRSALYLDIQRSSGGDFEQQWRLNGGWRISF